MPKPHLELESAASPEAKASALLADRIREALKLSRAERRRRGNRLSRVEMEEALVIAEMQAGVGSTAPRTKGT